MLERQPHLAEVTIPANLRLNDQIQAYREECRRHGCDSWYHHFAFGQSPFPPPPTVVRALSQAADRHDYLPTAGLPELRSAVAEYHGRTFGVPYRLDQVVVGPGSKELISIALTVLPGPVLIPTPAWVSYLPQAKILGKPVRAVPTRAADGHKLTPEALERAVLGLTASQSLLILNQPNNPTGAVYTRAELRALTDVCRRYRIVVIADEIYALTTFDISEFTSMAQLYPEGTVVTGGLSKDRSAGGYRVGVALFPEEEPELVADALKVAGSTYSCVAAPLQHAALEAYSDSPGVQRHVEDCRAINALAGRTLHRRLARIEGLRVTAPRGAFYLFVDFGEQFDALRRIGIERCSEMADHLLQVEHCAVLPGEALLLPPERFAVRCSFVDYDGARALDAWRRARPISSQEETAFAATHFESLLSGADRIAHYVGELRAGRRPEHG